MFVARWREESPSRARDEPKRARDRFADALLSVRRAIGHFGKHIRHRDGKSWKTDPVTRSEIFGKIAALGVHFLFVSLCFRYQKKRERERESSPLFHSAPFVFILLKCILAYPFVFISTFILYKHCPFYGAHWEFCTESLISIARPFRSRAAEEAKTDVARTIIGFETSVNSSEISVNPSRGSDWKRIEHKKRRGCRLHLVRMRAGDLAAIN